MVKDDKVYLVHILDSINQIEKYIYGITNEKFAQSLEKQDSIYRRFEIIGEAVKNISEDLKNNNVHIYWKKIAGMRDKLIHEYFGVDTDLVWKTIKKDLPLLKKDIADLLK